MAGKPWEKYQSLPSSGPWTKYQTGAGLPDIEMPDEPGDLEALARGAEQGATLGFGDEINGGASALLDQLTGKNQDLSLLDDYYKQRNDSRAKFKASEDAHPYISGAGNLIGALAPALLTGGGSLAEEGAAAAAKKAATSGIGDAIEKGAAYGAISGVGNSESDNANDIAKDALVGAGTGGVIGTGAHIVAGALSPLAQLAGKAGSVAADLPVVQNMKDAFMQGAQYGRRTIGKTANTALNNEIIDLGDQLSGDIQDQLNQAKTTKTNSLAGAGDTIDMLPWLKQFRQSFQALKQQYGSDPQKLQELKRVSDMVLAKFEGVPDENIKGLGNQWTAVDAEDFLRQLGALGSEGENPLKTTVAKTLVNRMISPFDYDPTMVDRYAAVDQNFQPLSQMISDARPQVTDVDGNVVQPGVSDLNDRISSLLEAKEQLPDVTDIANLEKANISGAKSSDNVENFLDTLPDDIADKYRDKMEELGNAKHVADATAAPGLHQGFLSKLTKGSLYGVPNLAGLTARELYEQSPETLKSVAQSVRALGGDVADKLGSILDQTADKDRIGRNALLFAVQQNPAYRELLRKATGQQEPAK